MNRAAHTKNVTHKTIFFHFKLTPPLVGWLVGSWLVANRKLMSAADRKTE